MQYIWRSVGLKLENDEPHEYKQTKNCATLW